MEELRWLFLIALAALFIVASLSEPASYGMSQEWVNGQYRFAGGTHPVFLVFGFLFAVLYLLLMLAPPANLLAPMPGIFRRFVAFWLDFVFALTIIGPLMGILPTLTEWRRTSEFAWSFSRKSQAAGDTWLVFVGFAICVPGLVFYYAYPLMRGRPSPGACIAGYQVVPDDGIEMNARTAIKRTLLGFVAACGAYFAPFVSRDRAKGKFWLDTMFHTRALTLK